jgi:hypothetical protein
MIWVVLIGGLWLLDELVSGSSSTRREMTKEEEARDAICGEMWREMGE